jgi:peptide deformylase
LQYPDPILKSKSSTVTEFDEKTRLLIEKMMAIMYSCNGLGLAAPQIGVLKQVIVIADPRTDANQGIALINPVISERSSEESEMTEECLSLVGLQVPVVRSDEIVLTAQDLTGKNHDHHITGPLAHVFAHEIDHLNGVLVIDYLDKKERREALELLRKTAA